MTTADSPSFKVSYLGPQASFSHQAALQLFPPTQEINKNVTLTACPSIPSLFTALTSGSVDLSIVPLENSTNGPVAQTLSLLSAASRSRDLEVCGETSVRVRHCLAGRRRDWRNQSATTSGKRDEIDLSYITSLHTHPQAWSQCTPFLDRHFRDGQVARHDEESTSGSARIVAADETGTSAAICSRLAAELFELDVLADDIHSDESNQTRFLVLRRKSHCGAVAVPSLANMPEKMGPSYALVACQLAGPSTREVVEHAVSLSGFESSKIYTAMSGEQEWISVFVEDEGDLRISLRQFKTSLDASDVTIQDWGVWTGIQPP